MATFYLDYEGGNDANDGTSFANRWKTITSGATAARIAPGDTIRIMGSPAPTSLGTTGSWTNKSATVTLGSARNVLITDCGSAWTASANVTATADASYFRGLTGDKSAKLAIASGFTTGKAAYFALGAAQDYSAYQGITLWVQIKTAASLAASTLSIRLCSDTTGDTPVDTLAIPAQTYVDRWFPVHIDKGSALGASIQSIALYADLDPGTIDVYLNNISTTKAASADDCLTLKTLIGKNTANETWWALRKISGTTLSIDTYAGQAYYNSGAAAKGYSGTTESVTTYIRKTIPTAQPQYSFLEVQTVQDAGTAGNLITYSGGWNRTDMSTQTLDMTFFDGETGFGTGLYTSLHTYVAIDRIACYRYTTGFQFYAGFKTVGSIRAGHCSTGIYLYALADSTFTDVIAAQNKNNMALWATRTSLGTVRLLSAGDVQDIGYGLWLENETNLVRFTDLYANNNRDGINGSSVAINQLRVDSFTTSDNARYGFVLDAATWLNWDIGSLVSTGNGDSGAYLGKGSGIIRSLTTSGNTTNGVIHGLAGVNIQDITVLKSSIAETSKLNVSTAGNWPVPLNVRWQKFNGVVDDHRHYMGGQSVTIFSETSVRHTASGLAWKINFGSTTVYTDSFPYAYPLCRVAVNGTGTVSASVWLRRSNTGMTAKLVCRGGQLDGIPIDQTVTMTAGADTWEKLTLTLGPTAAGVIDIEVHAYTSNTTYSLYLDDVSVSQV